MRCDWQSVGAAEPTRVTGRRAVRRAAGAQIPGRHMCRPSVGRPSVGRPSVGRPLENWSAGGGRSMAGLQGARAGAGQWPRPRGWAPPSRARESRARESRARESRAQGSRTGGEAELDAGTQIPGVKSRSRTQPRPSRGSANRHESSSGDAVCIRRPDSPGSWCPHDPMEWRGLFRRWSRALRTRGICRSGRGPR